MSSLQSSSRRLRARLAVLLSVTALVVPLAALAMSAPATDASGVLRATLPNGLRVVIVRNTLAPVVTTNVNYRVGADETPPEFPGMAHAQEHMMFRGSPGLSADQLADIGSVMGGSFNADTRQTITQYLYTVPAADLDVALHIEAQRMRAVFDSAADWKQERGAIEQEVAQDTSSPDYQMFTQLRSALFAGTPYAHDGLGTHASFERTTAAMLKRFHDQWYAPNNAVLVIAGDVDPQATLATVKQLFGGIAARPLPPRPAVALTPVAPQALRIDSDLPYAMQVVAMRLPGIDSPDFPAAELLVDVLNSERGALHDLVVHGHALAAGFSMDPLPKSTLAYAGVAFPRGGNAPAIEAEIRAVLADIAAHGVPPDLVAAAKRQEKRSLEFQKNSISGLADVWSEALAVYSLNSPDDDLTRIDRVSVADIDRVARTWFDPAHTVTALLTPRDSGKPVAAHGFGGQESIALGTGKPRSLPAWAAAAMGRLEVPASTLHPVVSTLPNGLTLIVQPEDVSDTVSIYGHIRNRPDTQVPPGHEGVSIVLDALMPYGTRSLDRVAFQKAVDAIGADVRAGTDFSAQVLRDDFPRAAQLLADNELHPALPEKAFDVVRTETAASVAGALGSPDYLSGRALKRALFPAHDPELREASPATVERLTRDDVRNYYRAVFRPDMTTIVVIGHITPAHAKQVIETAFGDWHAQGPKPAIDLPTVPPSVASASNVPDQARVQDRVTLGETLGLNRLSPDYYALQLGNSVLGGAFYSTRLTRDIRKNAGLVYSIESDLQFGKTRGVYTVDYACAPANVGKVAQMTADEIRRMQQTPVSPDELRRAQALLLHQLPLAEADVGGIAHGLLARVALDLPLDEPTRAARHYLALDAPAVQRAFGKWLRPAALARVSQGPAPR